METIVPYIEKDGIPNMPDSFLASCYNTLESDGISKIAFYDGSVRCANDFVKMFKRKDQLLFVVFRDDKPIMIAWLNTFEGKRAQGHFAMFKCGLCKETTRIGKMVLDYILNIKGENGFVFDVVYGITPTSNKLACRAVKKVFDFSAIIPNFCYNFWTQTACGGMVSYKTRAGKNEDL